MRRATLAATLIALQVPLASVASAQSRDARDASTSQEPTTHKPAGYSAYELETIKSATTALDEKLDDAPEGKTIERIDVYPLEVIEARDPAPDFLNIFHTTSRPYVIEREVLQRPGERYKQTLADETARNLRGLAQISVVLVLAVKGSAPDKVRILVITKDVWSLRLNSSFAVSSGGLESLLVQPSETNIAGTQQTVLARYSYLPESQSFGVGYRVPRLDGRRLYLLADANLIMNRRTGDLEGHYGAVSIQRPLFSTLTEWGWGTGVAWRDEILRRYVNAKLSTFAVAGANPGDPVIDTGIPYEYRARRLTESAAITRSYGWENKNDFSIGAEMNLRQYRTGDLSRFDPVRAQQFLTTAVPISDTRVGPFVQWRGYRTNFVRVLDFEALGLQEDYRLGPDLWLRVYPVTTAFGSTRSFFGTYAAAQYTVRFGESDGLARASIESTTEAEVDRLSDAAVGANLHIVTPSLGFGRFVADGAFLNRYRNYLNRTTFLGGDSRLRGYPTSFFLGKDVVAMNAEFRSRPVTILKAVHAGVAAFYDVGDATNGLDHLNLHQSVGGGLRVLFPQVDKVVFRIDVGVPLGPRPAGVSPVGFYAAFEQAFPINNVGGTVATGGTGSPVIGGSLGQ